MAENEAQNINTESGNGEQTQSTRTGPDPKILAIISYLTLAGWLVAYVINSNNKGKADFTLFHIRQSLGVGLLWVAAYALQWIIPPFAWIANVIIVIMMIMGIVFAVQMEKRELPIVGKYFQDWFKSIS
jgi:uncharacterized membrane protein